jgi:hypothetical protein
MTKFNKNWLLCLYDKSGWCFERVPIKDKYEWEASEHAGNIARENKRADDWALMPAKA